MCKQNKTILKKNKDLNTACFLDGSGGEELLNETSRKMNLFEPTVRALCDAISSALDKGVAIAVPSRGSEQIRQDFDKCVTRLLSKKVSENAAKAEAKALCR